MNVLFTKFLCYTLKVFSEHALIIKTDVYDWNMREGTAKGEGQEKEGGMLTSV